MIPIQVCVGCTVPKPHSRVYFYVGRSGNGKKKRKLRVRCKVCVRKDVSANRALKAEYYATALASRKADPERQRRRRASQAAWRRTPKGRALVNMLARIRRRVNRSELVQS